LIPFWKINYFKKFPRVWNIWVGFFRKTVLGLISRTFFPGKIGKFSPKNVGGKLEFSAEKVLKNRFPQKLRGNFRGK
jgi:hypothetical protein